jgi:23S rRNA pseudouridine2605 synthase
MTPARPPRPSAGGDRSRPSAGGDRPRPPAGGGGSTRGGGSRSSAGGDRSRSTTGNGSRPPRSGTSPRRPRPAGGQQPAGGLPGQPSGGSRRGDPAAGRPGAAAGRSRTRQGGSGPATTGSSRPANAERRAAGPNRGAAEGRSSSHERRAAAGRVRDPDRRAEAEGRAAGRSGRRAADSRPGGRPAKGAPTGTRGRPERAAVARATSGVPAPGGDRGEPVRLNKALSRAGLGSRRAVEDLVRAGRVSIGGAVVHDLGRRVDPVNDRVEVDGSRVVLDERRRYWLLNKPAGVVSTAADPAGRPTVVGMVPEQPRVFPVGRLDRDTEGLLLLTNDGPLAYRLTHARYGIEKRYLAEVERLPADAPGRLRRGIELEDGFARPVRVRVVAGSGRRRMVEVVLVEGRNREVRRLLDAVGAPVRRLVRTAVGPIRLTGLAPGEFRPLRPEEIRSLYKAAGL